MESVPRHLLRKVGLNKEDMMPVKFRFDHILILVHDLAAASKDYATLGFNVVAGGEHESGATRNALVPFADGTYLELLIFTGPLKLVDPTISATPTAVSGRTRRWQSADKGLLDFALYPQEMESALEAARSRGLPMVGPMNGSRLRPDGQRVAWQFGLPDAVKLPFLCSDVTPKALRVPGGTARQHANGVLGIKGITIMVKNLQSSAAHYQALTGIAPQRGTTISLPQAHTVDFVLDGGTITLAAPVDENSTWHDHLEAHGEGPYALQLWTSDPDKAGILDLNLTHQARIALVSAAQAESNSAK